MSKINKLFIECESRNLHVCIVWQSITGYCVEIYSGYKKNYVGHFFSDSHLSAKEAAKEGLKYLKSKN